MSHRYNHKISRQAYESLLRRTRALQLRRQTAALIVIIVVALIILLGSSIRAFAGARDETELYKYYTSIQVQSGDTLWDIADRYTVDGIMDREAFIDEVTALNGLKDGQIRSGDYIVVSYYSERGQ